MGMTLGTKLVNTFGQVILAWLLLPEHFGLVGLAYTVTALTNLVSQMGVREVLIRRHRRFHLWANPAFWMTLTFGVLASIAILIAAPVAMWLYGEPKLLGLLLVLACAAPIMSLQLVPLAKIQHQLRFKFLAGTGLLQAFANMLLSIIFAYYGFGAYSFVLPVPIVGLAYTLLLWAATRPPVSRHPQFRRWRHLLADTSVITLTGIFSRLISFGDYIVLGIMFTDQVVGLYYFAFRLSLQTITMFTLSLTNVLFPALSKLQDSLQRQTQAYLRACRLLAVVVIPLCLLQAALAEPGVRAVFSDKWYPAIPVLQVLSCGMLLQAVSMSSLSLLQAQGRFTTSLKLTIASAALFLPLAPIGAWWWQGVGVATTLAIHYAIIGPISIYVAIRSGGGRWTDVWKIFAAPIGAAVLANGLAIYAAAQIPDIPSRDWVRIAVTLAVCLLVYIPAIRWIAPDLMTEFVQRIKSAIPTKAASSRHPG